MNLSIVILAAGLGKRMQNADIPKVLALLKTHPLIYYVLNTALQLKPQKICLVVGHKRELVIDYINNTFVFDYVSKNDAVTTQSLNKMITFAEQKEQLGTGHAVLCSEHLFNNYDGKILILSGDVPLLNKKTLVDFINKSGSSDLTVLTAEATNPFGYGRMIRDDKNQIISIVEEKDATDTQKLIQEINSGIYLVNAKLLYNSLKEVKNTNSQNEFYLTDIVAIALKHQKKVLAIPIANFNEIKGVNTIQQLAELESLL